MKNLNRHCEKLVRERFEENLASGRAVRDYMENSTAIYHGDPVACLYVPKFFSAAAHEYLSAAAETICAILEKVIRRYLDDADYRRLFPFEPELEKLILTDAGYSHMLPIARLDIFWNEDDFSFKFCEFNADGASGMNECRELYNAHRESEIVRQMSREFDLRPFELFDSWVQEFLEICGKSAPRVVIADFMDLATPNEFIAFRDAFRKAGIETGICDIRELRYTGGELQTPDGKKIDAIYRRAVTRDIMERREEAAQFLQAAASGAVCVIGHFRTQVIHNKAIFRILRMPETAAFLSDSENEFLRRHIPDTFELKTGAFDLPEVLANKDDWIIKPEDLYGARGVFAGIDMSADEWRKTVTGAMDTDYLLQKYCRPYRSANLDFNGGNDNPAFEEYNNITGMFLYGGKLAGLYSRAGQYGTISSHERGMTLASYSAEKNSVG